MANRRAYGFRWFTGNPSPMPAPRYYWVATGYDGQDTGANSCDINIGDPVKRVSTGSIALAVAGDEVLGIVVSFRPYWNGTAMTPTKKLPNQNSWGTVDSRRPYVGVVPAKAGLWECDFDAAHSTPTKAGYLALIGENFDHILTGNTTAVSARPEMDMNTNATTDATWRFEGLSPVIQDYTAAYVKGLFSINESEEGGSAAAGSLYNGI